MICTHPDPATLPNDFRAPDHGLGYYLSTYCEHGLSEQCRLDCKTCKALCACTCHGGVAAHGIRGGDAKAEA